MNCAGWPTWTLAMSASFTCAAILSLLVSVRIMNGWVEVLLEPAPIYSPLTPFMAATLALAGAISVVAARLSWAVFN